MLWDGITDEQTDKRTIQMLDALGFSNRRHKNVSAIPDVQLLYNITNCSIYNIIYYCVYRE